MDEHSRSWPLLPGQRWLLYQALHQPALARPVQRVYRLQPQLNTAALSKAYRQVVQAHPSLRLQLINADHPEKCAQFFPLSDNRIAGLEITGRTADLRAAYAKHVFAEDAAKPFDLEQNIRIFARVISVDGEHYLGLCLDHIAADDVATDLLLLELNTRYSRECQGLSQQFTDATNDLLIYLHRENSYPQGSIEQQNLAYWLERLRGTPLATHHGDSLEWVKGAQQRWGIEGGSFLSLIQACRQGHCSLFASVLAAEARLLGELGATDVLVMNIPVSNRVRPSDHRLIANLSMLLHLRLRGVRSSSPKEFLHHVRDEILEGMVHRHYHYADLSQAVAADATSRGGHVSWLLGCSYILERRLETTRNCLFAERLDDQPNQQLHIPRGAFTLTCRQNRTHLAFSLDWDPAFWSLDPADVPSQFVAALATLTEPWLDCPLHAS